MAYKTSHRLKVMYFNDFNKKIDKKLEEQIEQYIKNNEDISWVITAGLDEWGEDDRSFLNSNKHMKELSETFPDLIFVLEYEPIDYCRLGECREYWCQGKVQEEYAEITIKDFDMNKLKEVK